MKERFGVAYDDSVTPLLEKINEDPSQLYRYDFKSLSNVKRQANPTQVFLRSIYL